MPLPSLKYLTPKPAAAKPIASLKQKNKLLVAILPGMYFKQKVVKNKLNAPHTQRTQLEMRFFFSTLSANSYFTVLSFFLGIEASSPAES